MPMSSSAKGQQRHSEEQGQARGFRNSADFRTRRARAVLVFLGKLDLTPQVA